jgi:dihydroflavonol-4-reductase
VGIAMPWSGERSGSATFWKRESSYGELFGKISEVIGRPASGLAFPAWLAKAAGLAGSIYGRLFKVMPPVSLAMVKLAMSEHYYTAGKAVRVLELPQRPVETAIEEAFAWFRDKGYLDIAILRRSLRAHPQPRRTRARGFAAKAT